MQPFYFCSLFWTYQSIKSNPAPAFFVFYFFFPFYSLSPIFSPFFFFFFGMCVSTEHISKINRSVLNLEARGMLGFQLRSSTNVPSCYCYALRVLCVALKKEGEKQKRGERCSMQWPAGKANLSPYENRGMYINIPTYVNRYTYPGFYLPTYIFIHTYHSYV